MRHYGGLEELILSVSRLKVFQHRRQEREKVSIWQWCDVVTSDHLLVSSAGELRNTATRYNRMRMEMGKIFKFQRLVVTLLISLSLVKKAGMHVIKKKKKKSGVLTISCE